MAAYYCKKCLYKPKGRLAFEICHCGERLIAAKNVKVRAQIVGRLRNARAGKQVSTKQSYRRYLASPAWRCIREQVLRRDNFRCRCCGLAAEVVHHREYDGATMCGESIDRLISLCKKCHKFIHRDDCSRRHGIRATEHKLLTILVTDSRSVCATPKADSHQAVAD